MGHYQFVFLMALMLNFHNAKWLKRLTFLPFYDKILILVLLYAHVVQKIALNYCIYAGMRNKERTCTIKGGFYEV